MAHHHWDAILSVLRAKAPAALNGADLSRFDNHARSRSENPGYKTKHGRAEVLAKLALVERLHDDGTTYKAAAARAGVSENQLHRWRKDPRFRR